MSVLKTPQVFKSAAHYLPHEAPMVLLESVCAMDAQQVVCQVCVDKKGVLAPFLNGDGDLPSWYAFEMMAQAIGVWSGWHGEQKGVAPRLGMLLGMRSFCAEVPVFINGALLTVHALQLLQDEKLASFDCCISMGDRVVAKGRLNVYQPDADEFKQLFGRSEMTP